MRKKYFRTIYLAFAFAIIMGGLGGCGTPANQPGTHPEPINHPDLNSPGPSPINSQPN